MLWNSMYSWSPLRHLLLLTILATLVLGSTSLPAMTTHAAPGSVIHERNPHPFQGGQAEGLLVATPNTLLLTPETTLTPPNGMPFAYYGFYESPVYLLDTSSNHMRLSYETRHPADTQLGVDVRASSDGQHWTAWQTDMVSGKLATFTQWADRIQYRVRFFSNAAANVTFQNLQVEPLSSSLPQVSQPHQEVEPVAPTFRLHATREGLVGHRTANGHIIQPRDHFVALPSWGVLSSRGGNEYQVRVTYNGRSVVAPVWDVGPWSTRDNYWDEQPQRESFPELEKGWPQSHAAFYHGHNGRRSDIGLFITNPSAIDLADGIWWDVLQIPGGTAEVEVTFLWMGRDPLAPEPPALDPAATEYQIDELGYSFSRNPEGQWGRTPAGCGEGHHAFWTLSVNDPAQADNRAFWQPNLPTTGLYDVYAHIPLCPNEHPPTAQARYLIQYDDGAAEVIVDQTTQTHWVYLGRFPFAEGTNGFVHLSDLAGDNERVVWFDSIKWVPVREESTAEAAPEAPAEEGAPEAPAEENDRERTAP